MDTIDEYIEAFRNMKRAKMGGYKAPHKPLLLLSIIELVRTGKCTSNKIILNENLISTFKDLWSKYVDSGNRSEGLFVADDLYLELSNKYPFKCTIANPFYHMQHEPFWRLIPSDVYVKKNNYDLRSLKKCFLYAEMDEQLFRMMQDNTSRDKLKTILESLI